MKSLLFILLCSSLLALVATFTKDDHEIFRLRDEIEASEGPEVTFYGKHPYIQPVKFIFFGLLFYSSRFLGGQSRRCSRRDRQSIQEEIQDHTS